MTNYKLLTGPFAGNIVSEGRILDVDFDLLDTDLQIRIREWAEEQEGYVIVNGGFGYRGGSDAPISMNQVSQDYEEFWESEETEEAIDLLPVSEW